MGPRKGDTSDDDSVGRTFDDLASGTGRLSDVLEDAGKEIGAAGVSRDAGGGVIEDTGVISGLVAGAGTRTDFSGDSG